ncbi:response regulator transcription factor [Flavobacterium gilvum]|uniref:Phosphate regulon transcriptional regulatory protein PhoB n=1 Tax=Flavobacterium gilvum TaxID=1492737 RepID=A0AAC9I626_9FLAO|nr:response regulator transcription factor [Flavobacterium gilvum]AOW10760.1 DNA-binding response regulator [Flavobacterium gilvum]
MDTALIIEDDQNISDLISIHLSDMEFEVDTAFDGKSGLLKALNNNYKIIILDVRLPELDGLEVCKRLRQEKVQTPILMVTSKSEEIDKIIGLEIGADDYLTKPFGIRELIARVKAILRRTEMTKERPKEIADQEMRISGLFINLDKRIVEVHDKRVELSPKEFDLLVLLASNPGRIYSRTQFLELVWGYQFEGYEHTVNSHINRLRAKIETDPNNPEFILTSWGVGYKFRE